MTNMNTPDSAVPVFASSFKVYVIKDKVMKSEIYYNPGGNAFIAVPFTAVALDAPYDST